MRRLMAVVAAVVVMALGIALAGCGSGSVQPGETPPAESTTTPEQPPGHGTGYLAPPALVELPGGRVRAIGTLARVDLEGGFWAVVDATPGTDLKGDEPVIAVVLLPEEDGMHGADMSALAGTYMQFDGTLVEGASIRMAGPEIMVDSFKMLEKP
ncbi:MAG: hypothetical protein Q8K99_08335 [Actinomycetota bacterium]|nr:hypothetical protein [Actinomycetota bacterium]